MTVGIAHSQARVVSQHGAGADQDDVRLGPQVVDVRAGGGAGDPATRTVSRSAAPVHRRGELPRHNGPAEVLCELPQLDQPVSLAPQVGVGHERDVDTACCQLISAACRSRGAVASGVDHASDSGFEQGLGAGAGAAGVPTRLEAHDSGPPGCALTGLRQRRDLRVNGAGPLVPALTDNLALVVQDDRADAGVRANRAAAGKL